MAGSAGNAAMMTCILVMLMAVSLRWVSGVDAKQLSDARKVDTDGADADEAAGAVGSRSVGEDIPQAPPPCASEPCQFSGECAVDGESYMCLCTAGHFGRQCDDADPCWSSPCLNLGKCIPRELDYTCNCQPGSTGRHCENATLSPAICTKTYCQHGGACKVNSDGLLSCVCTTGYVGQHCQLAAGSVNGTNTTNETNNTSDAFPLSRRQHGRSIYDVLMLDVAVIGAMSVAFSIFMCACVTCEFKSRQPGEDGAEREDDEGNDFFGWFVNTTGSEQNKLLTKKP